MAERDRESRKGSRRDVSEWSKRLTARQASRLLRDVTRDNTEAFVPPICWGRAVSVYDGDTMTVAAPLYPGVTARFSLRMEGYDSPEIRTRNSGEKRIALIARDKLRELVDGALLRVEVSGVGKYGRPLATVYVQSYDNKSNPLDISLNQWMLQHSLAVPYDGGTKRKVDWPKYYEQGKLRERGLVKRQLSRKKMDALAKSVYAK